MVIRAGAPRPSQPFRVAAYNGCGQPREPMTGASTVVFTHAGNSIHDQRQPGHAGGWLRYHYTTPVLILCQRFQWSLRPTIEATY